MMKSPLTNVKITQVSWCEAEDYLREVRQVVFVEEQDVAPDFEWDQIDTTAIHLIAVLDSRPIACLRIIYCHKIGRMAVLKEWRGLGLEPLYC